ncbi:MAG TPA: preprotein translocase subunit YajC [Acidimicrobiales bacterium]|nr:preprotein translocase subunit YajC [Acidimicrobiales bacterium]
MEQLLFPVAIIGAMWLLLIRPQQKRAKAQRDLLSALEVGDQVVTVGGIVGRITELTDRELIIRSENSELRLVRGAIGSRIDPSASAEVEGDAGPDSSIV